MYPTRLSSHVRAMLFLSLLAGLGGGCNSVLVGSWKADPIPEGVDSYIAHANFRDDGTYEMFERNQEAEKSIRHGGQYQFDGFRLKLKRPSKKDLIYPAMYNSFNGTLKVTVGEKKQSLKKQ
ncbi:MAG: hypothetical protein ACE5EC_04275 [Phycisphaerae bacterium]